MGINKSYLVSLLITINFNIFLGANTVAALDLKGWFDNLGKKDEKVSDDTSSSVKSQSIPINNGGVKEVTLKDTKGKTYIYREAAVQETERVTLPSSLQSKINKTALDNIELSNLLAKGVKAKRGFTVNIKYTLSDGNMQNHTDCDALDSGLLSCVSKFSSKFLKKSANSIDKTEERSISTHGGLVRLARQVSASNSGTHDVQIISEILPNIKKLEKPYELDILYSNIFFDNMTKVDYWTDTNHKYKHTKCRVPKSENSGSIPRIGEYILLFCSEYFHQPELSTITETGKYNIQSGKQFKDIDLDRILTSEQPDLSSFFSQFDNPVHIQFAPFYYFAEHGLILPAELFEKKYLPQKYQQAIFVNPRSWGPGHSPSFSNDISTNEIDFKLK